MRRASLAACALAAAAALLGPDAARAHVVPEPQFVTSGAVASLNLAVPNERPEVMNALAVTVPEGFRIVEARPTRGWQTEVEGTTATWSGGRLPHLEVETFVLDVDVTADPGTATIDSRQLYPSGDSVTWPAMLTVVPGADRTSETSSQNLGWALVAGLVGLAVTLGVAVLAWRRRAGSLQEK